MLSGRTPTMFSTFGLDTAVLVRSGDITHLMTNILLRSWEDLTGSTSALSSRNVWAEQFSDPRGNLRLGNRWGLLAPRWPPCGCTSRTASGNYLDGADGGTHAHSVVHGSRRSPGD